MTTKIRFEDVSKVFQARGREMTVLQDISFDVRNGEFLVVVGPSGCGKSTLLDLLGGLSEPTSGRILVNGVPVTGPGLDRGIVFQQYAFLPWRTAQGNVEFGLEAKGIARKQIIDIPITERSATEDLRSDPEFTRYRQEIWGLLRDEVTKAQAQELRSDRKEDSVA